MPKKEVWLLLVQLLLSVLLILYLIGRSKGLPVFFFWPIAISLVLVSFLMIQNKGRYQLLSLCLLSVTISAIPLVVVPEPFSVGVDGAFEAQFAQIIVKEGKLDPTLGSGFAQNYYGHNPVLHLVLAFASLTSGINTYVLLKYFFFIFIRLATVLLVFAVIATLLENARKENRYQDIAFWALFIFIGSAGMAFIGVTRRSVASLFFLLCILAMLKARDEKKAIWNILYMIFAFMVVISNHSISFYLLLFLAGAWLFAMALRLARPNMVLFKGIGYKFMYVVAMLLIWEVLLSGVFVREDLMYLSQIIQNSVTGEGLSSLVSEKTASGIDIYRSYETFAIYGAQLLFLLLGALGFWWYLKQFRAQEDSVSTTPYFLLYIGIFGFGMFIASALFMKTGHDTAVTIILWFFCLPISIFIAYFMLTVAKTIQKKYIPLLACLVIFLFVGSLLMGINTPRITNRAMGEDIVVEVDSRSITDDLYAAGKWLEEHSTNAKVLGDFTIFNTFSGFFLLGVNSDREYLEKLYRGGSRDIGWLIANERIEFGSYQHTFLHDKLDYFVVNRAFSKYASIGFGKPIAIDTKNLDEDSMLDHVYSNNEIEIYQIQRG